MKILLATDGSEFSRRAIETACENYIFPGSEIKIVSVFEDFAPASAEPFAVSAEYVREMDKIGRRQSTEAVKRSEEIIFGRFPNNGISVTSKIDKGAASKVIVEEAKDWNADLIILGSHGYGFWRRTLIGSVSLDVVHHAPCSVLLIKKKT